MAEIDSNTRRLLLAACGLKEYDHLGRDTEVPAEVARKFQEFNRCFCRLSGTVCSTEMLAFIASSSGFGATAVEGTDGPAFNAAALFLSGELKFGDGVLVEWRGEKRNAKIRGAKKNGNRITAQLDGETFERDFPIDKVFSAQTAKA